MRLGRSALDLLFPPQCFGCDTYGSYLCLPCESSLVRLDPPYCETCARPRPPNRLCGDCASSRPAIDGIRAPYLMEGTIREGVHSLKYRNVRSAAPTLGGLIAGWLSSTPVPGEALVPVPLHARRLRERGYNQSALLAKEVGKRTGLPVVEGMLLRTRDTPPQTTMPGRAERARNVEGSFSCRGDPRGQNLVLVDDVVTTGSTMFACATALKAAGAAVVWGLALAREGPAPGPTPGQ